MRKYLSILVICIILSSIVYVVRNNFDNNTLLDDVSLKEDSSSKSGIFAIMIENDDGEYEEYTDSSWPSGMVFNEENSGCIDSEGNSVSATLSYSDGYVSVSTNDTVYCYLYFDMPLDCVKEGITNLAECILRSENNFDSEEEAIEYIKNEKGTPDFSSTATDDEGLYYAEDDYGDSYYFRGAVTDNYVYFAGFYWRIIRINGDGSIRMIYDGTSAHGNGTSTTNSRITTNIYSSGSTSNEYSANAGVGYMRGTVYTESISTSTTVKLQSYYYYYGTSYTFDASTGYYSLDGTITREVWNSSLEGMYTCRGTSASGTCTSLYEIDEYTSSTSGTYYLHTRVSCTDEDCTTSYTDSKAESTSTATFATSFPCAITYSYNSNSFRPYKLTNYDTCVYDGTDALNGYYVANGCTSGGGNSSNYYEYCSTLYYVESANDVFTANVTLYGLSYSDYETTHANIYNSAPKNSIDSWYEENIYNKTDGTNSYDDYISDTLFCGDRSLYSGTGIGTTTTYYGAYERLYLNKSPILTCPNKTNDAYTIDDEVNGNSALTYKVAMITADEVAMAGGVSGTSNSNYYLYTGNSYWTMTPYSNTVYYVTSTGQLGFSGIRISLQGIRPVINLSSSVILTSGDGTKDSPYEVTLQ